MGIKEEKEQFEINTDDKADWALQKIKELKEKKEEKKELAEKRKYQIDQWEEKQTKKIDKQINNLESLLEDYAFKLKEEDKEFKTKDLPFGKIQFRKQRPKWNYEDEDKLLEYAEKNMTDIIKTKKKISKKDLKKKVEIAGNKVINPETGEVIEGVSIKERGEKLYIKPE
ncbi:MAG: host-nuclease inhibitor Gam family protein [Halanaerobiales bacterium]